MLRFRSWRTPVVALAAVASLAACGDQQGPAGMTPVTVLLKDAPGDVKKAVVTISEISLIGANGSVVLLSTPTTTDLVALAQSTQQLLHDTDVPSGTYTEMRLKLSGGYIEVENADGSSSIYASSPTYGGLPSGVTPTGHLQMPSLAQSGLKIDFSGTTLTFSGTERIFVLDFDVSQSFGHVAGNSGQWVMHPVIKGAEASLTGSVAVTVKTADGVVLPTVGGTPVTLAGFSAVLTNTADNTETVIPLTDANADGTFEANFAFVGPGSYQLTLKLPTGVTSVTTSPATPATVTVASGQQVVVALTVTAVT